MDAQDRSANVEASGRRETEAATATRARSIDYGPIIDGMVGRLARSTTDRRRGIYAHARSIITRALAATRLPQAAVELEKLALDLAIARVEQRWRAKEAHKKSEKAHKTAAAKSAAEKAIPPNMPDRQDEPSETAAAPIAANSLRGLAWPIGIAVALPIAATAIFYLSHIDGKFIYGGEVGDRVGRSLSDSRGGPNISAHRGLSQASPIHPALPAAPMPKTAGAVWPESYGAFGDMTWGPSNALSGPTVAAEDFAVDRVTPYPALVPDAAPMSAPPSPAAVPRAAAPQEPQVPPIKPPNAKVAALVASGKQAALNGDLDRAIRDFSEAIRIDPKNPESYLERGRTSFKLGETERAIADYSAALGHDPQHAAALHARGMAHLYLGKTDLALGDLSKAIELAEQDPRLLTPLELFYARRSRGSIYDSREEYHLEIADCTALIDSYAHDPVLAEALAANYGSGGTANILARLYRQRANALVRTSRAERAVADLTDAIRLSSDRGYAALLDRSKLHELLGRRDLAAADARAALNIRPGSEEAQLALSRLSALSNPAPPNGL